jgi:hypothetical protein
MTALKKAGNAGHKIEKAEKQRWTDYVRSNKIPEAAMGKRGEAEGVGGRLRYVIIDNDGNGTDTTFIPRMTSSLSSTTSGRFDDCIAAERSFLNACLVFVRYRKLLRSSFIRQQV